MESGTQALAPSAQRSGRIAIFGRSNVGKSTLLNHLVGHKVSIVSHRAQTTQSVVAGIRHWGASEFIFLDTPGLPPKASVAPEGLLRALAAALHQAQLALFVTQAGRFSEEDAFVRQLAPEGLAIVFIANQIDRVHPKSRLLPWLQEMQQLEERLPSPARSFFPMCARSVSDVERLLPLLQPLLPEAPWEFPADTHRHQSDEDFASEIIREQFFRGLGDEIPYRLRISIARLERTTSHSGQPLLRVQAEVTAQRRAHLAMLIGAGGARLERLRLLARKEMERWLGVRTRLSIHAQCSED